MKRMLSILMTGAMTFAPLSGAWAQSADATEASEPDADRFKALTTSASEKYDAEDYDGAIVDFLAAYEIKQVSNILYNVARLYEKVGKLEDAIDYYQRFVKAPNVEQAARQDALERIKTLKEVVALDQEAATEPEPQPQAKPQVVSSQPPVEEPDYTWAYVLWGAGALTLGASGVFAILTQHEANDFEDASTLEARRDAADAGETYGILSDSLLIAGAGIAIAGTIVFFATGSDTENVPEGSAFAPMILPGGAGAAWTLRFE